MPKSYIQIAATCDVPLFIFGDHASNHIPAEFSNLGLSGTDLSRHIAWDIGTNVMVRDIAAYFGCAAQLANLSRLVIDLNRDVHMPCLIPEESDGSYIPGNYAVTQEERARRIALYHKPYHDALRAALSNYDDPLVVSVHSFTAKPTMGDMRHIDIGLLVKHDQDSAKRFEAELSRQYPNYRIGINEPYSAHILNYTIDKNVAEAGLRHLAIEINQGLVATCSDAQTMANILANALAPLIAEAKRAEPKRGEDGVKPYKGAVSV